MEWTDSGIVIAARPMNEQDAIVTLLAREQGRHAGMVRGAHSPKQAAMLQVGTLVQATWRARLADSLGHYRLESLHSPLGDVMQDKTRLAILRAACAVAVTALPERHPYPEIYDGLAALIRLLDSPYLGYLYVGWEMGLLSALGFGLDLASCAAGGNDRLAWVSPRTGRAVSLSMGEAYRDRLLPLPAFLLGEDDGDIHAVRDGLRLTGHFLERCIYGALNQPVPAARAELKL